jgi:hypothetical protein
MLTTRSDTEPSELPDSFYLPWTDGVNNLEEGIQFGKELARKSRLPLEIGIPLLNQIPEMLAKLPHFTERSRSSLRVPRVVLLLHPTFKLLAHGRASGGGYTVVVEFPTSTLHGWAAFAGAINLKTKERMAPVLSDEALALYKRIEWNGNNAWADDHGKRTAKQDLGKLSSMGELDVDLLRGYMLIRKDEKAVERLIKLAETVRKRADR